MQPNAAVRLLTSRFSRSLFRPLMRERTPIFMLHRVEDPGHGIHGHSIEFLQAALAALRDSGAHFASLRTLVEAWRCNAPIDPDWVVFTADDGFADQEILVREVFAPMQCPLTIFLISGFLDGRLWPWDDQLAYTVTHAPLQKADVTIGARRFSLDLRSADTRRTAVDELRVYCKTVPGLDPYATVEQLARSLGVSVPGEPPPQFRPMSWDTARDLERHGAHFGPHSVTHRIFSNLSEHDARAEIATSWARLQQELRDPLSVFAWPTGRSQDFSAANIQMARDIGLHASVATDPGYACRAPNGAAANLYRIRRFAMPNDLTTVLRYGSWLERGRELLPI